MAHRIAARVAASCLLAATAISLAGTDARAAEDYNSRDAVDASTKSEFETVFPDHYRDMMLDAAKAYGDKDYDKAFELFHRTACGGDKQSQSAVGRMYVLGQGVQANDLTGYAWLKVAAEVIFPKYQAVVRDMAADMTPAQRTVADAKAQRLIDLYGLAGAKTSCQTNASRGGLITDEIICTPTRQGNRCCCGAAWRTNRPTERGLAPRVWRATHEVGPPLPPRWKDRVSGPEAPPERMNAIA